MRFIATIASLALLGACTTMHHDAPAPTAAPVAAAAPAPAAAPAAAQAPAQRFGGEVTAANGRQLTVHSADGHDAVVTIAPDAHIVIGYVIQASDIHPGDFVATANTNVDAANGRSVELRVFPPGLKLGEGSYPMQEPNTTMTNATVAEVTNVSGGRELTVRYPGGERHILLPSDIVVVGQRYGDMNVLQVGAQIRGRARPDASGALVADYVYTGENGRAPPGR